MKSLPAVALSALFLGLGCSTSADAAAGDAGDTAGGDTAAERTIGFLESGPVELVYRESHVVVVQVSADGRPLGGVRIELALEGDAQDSSLGDAVLTTDAAGRAQGSVVAATVSVSFAVRAALATGETARLEFRTRAPDDVRVTLAPDYGGARHVPTYSVTLTPNGTCPAVYAGPTDPGDSVTLTVDAADPTFSVPRSMLFSALEVAVVGVDRVVGDDGIVADAALLWGCVDAVAVPPAGLATLPVSLADLPWPLPGTHRVSIVAPLDAATAPVVRDAFTPFAALLDGETTAGAFVLDGIAATLHASGLDAVADVLAARRTLDPLDDAVGGEVPDLADALRSARDSAAAFLAAASIDGQLALGEVDTTGHAASQDRWLSLTDGSTVLPLSDGAGAPIEAVARAAPASSGFALLEHDLPLSLRRAVELTLDAQLGDPAADWTDALAARLAALVPCADVAATLAASADLAMVCDGACLQPICEAWRDGLVAASASALDAAETDYTSVAVTAACSFLDAGGRLVEDGSCTGSAAVRWHGLASTASLPGAFTVRAGTIP